MNLSRIATADLRFYDQFIPDYMLDVYDWAYVKPRNVRWLDRNIVVKTLLFCNDGRLMRRYLEHIQSGMRVWQVAHVYGDLVKRAADRTGPAGAFHLTDVTPIQIDHAQRKLAGRDWCQIVRHDAASYAPLGEAPFDLICSFMLLHEVPDEKKRQILNHLLAQLPKHGTLVLVDYHRPAWWQPIRWILKLVNAWLEPFAEALWEHDLQHFCHEAHRFSWEKTTLFGGVYQCVLVRHVDATQNSQVETA